MVLYLVEAATSNLTSLKLLFITWRNFSGQPAQVDEESRQKYWNNPRLHFKDVSECQVHF